MNKRESNIELLRIVLIFFVINLHYSGSYLGDACNLAKAYNNLNYILLVITRSFGICAVNCFMLITGYFMYNKKTVNLSKAIRLLLIVSLCNGLNYIINNGLLLHSFSNKTLIRSFIPSNWYAWLYCSVYLISPFLNRVYNRLDKRSFNLYIILIMVLFSVIPTFVESANKIHINLGISTIGMSGNDDGHNIVNFLLCYFIGSYIRFLKELDSPVIKDVKISGGAM